VPYCPYCPGSANGDGISCCMRVSAAGVRAAIWVDQASGQHGGLEGGRRQWRATTGRKVRGQGRQQPIGQAVSTASRLGRFGRGGVEKLGPYCGSSSAQGWRGRAALEPWKFLAITDVGGARRRIGLCVGRFAPESYDGQADGPELLGVGPSTLRHVRQGATGPIAACDWQAGLQPL